MSWAPRKEAVLQEKGTLAAGGLFYISNGLSTGISPLDPRGISPGQRKKETKRKLFSGDTGSCFKTKISLTEATFLL